MSGPDLENYIKSQIELGYETRNILSTLLNEPYQDRTQLKDLGLSEEFISTWLVYPSGRLIPSSVFLMNKPDVSPSVPILTRDDEGYFIQKEDGTIVRMPCFGTVMEIFNVPLTGEKVNVSSCTPYEYEPDSYTFYGCGQQLDTKSIHEILFAPDYDMAVYHFIKTNRFGRMRPKDLSKAYPGFITPDVLAALEARYINIIEGGECNPTQEPLIPPRIAKNIICHVMLFLDMVVAGDQFIAPYFELWLKRPGIPFFSYYRRQRMSNEELAQEYALANGFSSPEAYLEDQISQGIFPQIALYDLEMDLSIYATSRFGNILRSFNQDVGHGGIQSRVGLKPEFMQKWFNYPSGRIHAQFKYLDELSSIDISTVRRLIPHPNILTRPGYLVEPGFELEYPAFAYSNDPEYTPLPCTFFDNQPLYIPVLRYERRNAKSYDEKLYCGTYYYFDDGPGLYLRSNKTLIVPTFAQALLYINGDNPNTALSLKNTAASNRTRERYGPNLSPEEAREITLREVLDDVRYNFDHCDRRDYKGTYEEGGRFESSLCSSAKKQGYDVIIATYPFRRRTNQAEVIDLRDRHVGFNNLFWRT